MTQTIENKEQSSRIKVRINGSFTLKVPSSAKFLYNTSTSGNSYEVWEIDNTPEQLQVIKNLGFGFKKDGDFDSLGVIKL